MHLDDLLTQHFRLGDIQKKALARLSLSTIRDLLYYLPVRYSSLSNHKLISECSHGEQVTLYGKLSHLKTKKSFRGKVPMAQGVLTDITGNTITITWFHQVFLAKQYHDGDTVKLSGKITVNDKGTMLNNPEIERAPDLPIDRHTSLFQDHPEYDFGYPVYPETKGITSKWIYHTIRKTLQTLPKESLIDRIPESLLKKYKLPSFATACIWIHMPQKKEHADTAKKRFAFEEIFMIQLARQQARAIFQKKFSYRITIDQDHIKKFIDRFPFTPTSAQMNAIHDIIKDLEKEHPMSRLVEGDVGSGKTFVAATVAAAVINNRPRASGGGIQKYGALQVAYMAPTEVLATQLFENFIEYFRGTGTQIALFTGSGCRKFPSKVASAKNSWTNISKSQVLKWIASGEIPIVIGTHALLSDRMKFKDLGLVVIDEQHRFGTKQRQKLARKDGLVPHYLSMTATPIPRTLAMTWYGDLDISLIDHMPQGRKPVITQIIPETKRADTYAHIKELLNQGRQMYVICPRINEPDETIAGALQLKSVASELERLHKKIFPEYHIESIHSKMTPTKKEEVMKRFYNHEIDILVATSVIEVGVNVPNATIIMIEGAERFGLAQLHQLRGRVLRGNHQPYCYLCTSDHINVQDATIKRLRALESTTSGFELAEMDMQLRGIGDVAGKKQWGVSDIGMEALKNINLVRHAREEASAIIQTDPDMQSYPLLAEHIQSTDCDLHFE